MIKKIRQILFWLPLVLLTFAVTGLKTPVYTDPGSVVTSRTFSNYYNFMIISDWGWNGLYHQKDVALQMGKTADSINAKFVATCGDNFQVAGVQSTKDPLWTSNFEKIYDARSLMIDWYPVLGNHDYMGNTRAEIDYSALSNRWKMPEHYYSIVKKVNDSISVLLLFLDTSPFITDYYKKPDKYPDLSSQDPDKELKWLKKTLAGSKEKCILVFGHHPVYSASKLHGDTKVMIEKVEPLLEKYHAQFYFCGHDHDLEHLRKKSGTVDYIITGTGGTNRPCSTDENSVFSKSEPAFTVVSLKSDSIRVSFVGVKGNIIYSFGKTYR